jgi:chromate transporter
LLLDAELVAKGLLTRTELIDAIAVGQFTRGPFSLSVTFVGYQINGIRAFISNGDIPTLICVCCPIESYGRNSKPFATFWML